jgi:hypothetical protein
MDVDDHPGKALSLEVVEMPFEKRTAADAHEHLCGIPAERPEPRAASCCENHPVHGHPLSREVS